MDTTKEKMKYVVGFMFTPDLDKVALILKNRPDWQKGKLNGIGGHIKDDESPYAAMIREFEEETGVRENEWREYCIMHGPDWIVYFFVCCLGTQRTGHICTMTDEIVGWFKVNELHKHPVISNLLWLVPMALDKMVNESTVNYDIK